MDPARLKAELRAKLVERLNEAHRVEIDSLLDELDPDREFDNDDRLELLDDSERLIELNINFDASPMTDSPATAVHALDLGGDQLFLISPSDWGIDYPAYAYGTFSKGNRQRAFEAAGAIIERSRLDRELPGGGGLPDQLEIASDFPLDVLRSTFAGVLRSRPEDARAAQEIASRAGFKASNSDSLVDKYLEAVVRRDIE